MFVKSGDERRSWITKNIAFENFTVHVRIHGRNLISIYCVETCQLIHRHDIRRVKLWFAKVHTIITKGFCCAWGRASVTRAPTLCEKQKILRSRTSHQHEIFSTLQSCDRQRYSRQRAWQVDYRDRFLPKVGVIEGFIFPANRKRWFFCTTHIVVIKFCPENLPVFQDHFAGSFSIQILITEQKSTKQYQSYQTEASRIARFA